MSASSGRGSAADRRALVERGCGGEDAGSLQPYPGWEYDRARENASCFHCGRRGHYSDKCPAKREGYRRVWLAVKFHEKEEAKRSALKAKWCGDTKRWYTFRSLGFTKRHFSKWRPCYA